MRIPPNQVFVFGKRGWDDFDCLRQPLPDRIKVLLLSDGGIFNPNLRPCGPKLSDPSRAMVKG
jgi:hypothetical protein